MMTLRQLRLLPSYLLHVCICHKIITQWAQKVVVLLSLNWRKNAHLYIPKLKEEGLFLRHYIDGEDKQKKKGYAPNKREDLESYSAKTFEVAESRLIPVDKQREKRE